MSRGAKPRLLPRRDARVSLSDTCTVPVRRKFSTWRKSAPSRSTKTAVPAASELGGTHAPGANWPLNMHASALFASLVSVSSVVQNSCAASRGAMQVSQCPHPVASLVTHGGSERASHAPGRQRSASPHWPPWQCLPSQLAQGAHGCSRPGTSSAIIPRNSALLATRTTRTFAPAVCVLRATAKASAGHGAAR